MGAVTLDVQPRAGDVGSGTNRGPIILLPVADPCLEKLVGMKGDSGTQKSCRKVCICSFSRGFTAVQGEHYLVRCLFLLQAE